MAILDKILKRKPPLSDAERIKQRLTEIASLNTANLEQVASGEEAVEIRCTAVAKLPFSPLLQHIAFSNSEQELARSGKQRIANLVEDKQLSISDAKAALNAKELEELASFLTADEFVEALFEDVKDENSFLELAKSSSSARIRQWAVKQIQDVDKLQALIKHSKGKDKSVYKIAKAAVDQSHILEQQKKDNAQQVIDLIDAIEKHSKSNFDNLYVAKKDLLARQWTELKHYSDASQQKVAESLFLQCDSVVDEATKAAQELAETQRSESEASEGKSAEEIENSSATIDGGVQDSEENIARRSDLIKGLQKVLENIVVADEAFDRAHFKLNIDNIGNRWIAVSPGGAPTEKQDRYSALMGAIEREMTAVEKGGSIAQAWDYLSSHSDGSNSKALEKPADDFIARVEMLSKQLPDSASLKNYLQGVKAWKKQRKENAEADLQLVKQIGGLINKSKSAIAGGRTGQAQGIRSSIEEKLAKLSSVPRHIEKQINTLDEEIGKVKDWKEYAVLPKKEALVEQMEALIGDAAIPDALATKIKRLQDEWKALSRGGYSDDGELWEKFRQAGDKAFEPCAEYFGEQGKIRQQNLENRKRLVGQLQEYHSNENWENPDWKSVSKLIQVAFNEWRSYQPVERAANKSVQADFDIAIGQIKEKLNAEYQRSHDQKQQLVDEAEKLVDLDDNRQAIEKTKQLQQRWKNIGQASQKHDQKLWKAFRKHCDAVFEKRKTLSDAFKNELEENKKKLLALCDELTAAAQGDLDSLRAKRERVAEIRDEYRAIGSLPKANAKALQKQFQQALDDFENGVKTKTAKAKAGIWDQALAIHLDIIQAAAGNELPTSPDRYFADSDQWSKPAKKNMECLYDAFIAGEKVEISSKDRRLICIRAEILAGIDSPASDQSLRMDYQVKQLAKGFGQGGQQAASAKEAMQQLIEEWLGLKSYDPSSYQESLQRLNLCREKLKI